MRKVLCLVAVAGAVTFGTPAQGEAEVFDCYENGHCQWLAGCDGDVVWDPPCRVQCWYESTCPPANSYCLIAAGDAGCGNPVG